MENITIIINDAPYGTEKPWERRSGLAAPALIPGGSRKMSWLKG